MASSFFPPYAGDLIFVYGLIDSYDAAPPFLSGSQDFRSSEDVEGQLPELTINAVYDHFGKPGSVRFIQFPFRSFSYLFLFRQLFLTPGM
ncbi:MAG: hypothetical protein NTZ57_08735, partial [Deltaproteobacteria bacterium]|nr:hypothetical protein [Deltaproteobacteria bacterium]